jgi:hypothetical protein
MVSSRRGSPPSMNSRAPRRCAVERADRLGGDDRRGLRLVRGDHIGRAGPSLRNSRGGPVDRQDVPGSEPGRDRSCGSSRPAPDLEDARVRLDGKRVNQGRAALARSPRVTRTPGRPRRTLRSPRRRARRFGWLARSPAWACTCTRRHRFRRRIGVSSPRHERGDFERRGSGIRVLGGSGALGGLEGTLSPAPGG